jgi:hypothetical protein
LATHKIHLLPLPFLQPSEQLHFSLILWLALDQTRRRPMSAPGGGTAFLLCPETATPTLHRDALGQARGSETVVTNLFTARPARVCPTG